MNEHLTFAAAIKKFCSYSGETLQQLAAELKKLTAEDRAWFTLEFAKVGVETSAPAVIADAGVVAS